MNSNVAPWYYLTQSIIQWINYVSVIAIIILFIILILIKIKKNIINKKIVALIIIAILLLIINYCTPIIEDALIKILRNFYGY